MAETGRGARGARWWWCESGRGTVPYKRCMPGQAERGGGAAVSGRNGSRGERGSPPAGPVWGVFPRCVRRRRGGARWQWWRKRRWWWWRKRRRGGGDDATGAGGGPAHARARGPTAPASEDTMAAAPGPRHAAVRPEIAAAAPRLSRCPAAHCPRARTRQRSQGAGLSAGRLRTTLRHTGPAPAPPPPGALGPAPICHRPPDRAGTTRAARLLPPRLTFRLARDSASPSSPCRFRHLEISQERHPGLT